MHPTVATNDPAAVEREVLAAYQAMFPEGDRAFVPRIFGWAREFFTGKLPGYLPVDAKYRSERAVALIGIVVRGLKTVNRSRDQGFDVWYIVQRCSPDHAIPIFEP